MPRKNGVKQLPRRRVYFKLSEPTANDVIVCGSFNDWESHSCRLRLGKKGVWSTFLLLHPGIYEYRFLVDGQWRNDSDAETVLNSYGTQNSVKVVA